MDINPQALLGLLFMAAFMGAVGYLFMGWLTGKQTPAAPVDDTTVPTGKLRSHHKDRPVPWSLANATDGGALSFGDTELRMEGAGAERAVAYTAIESIEVQTFGPSSVLNIRVRDDDTAWTGWVGERQLPRLLMLLQSKGVAVRQQAQHKEVTVEREA